MRARISVLFACVFYGSLIDYTLADEIRWATKVTPSHAYSTLGVPDFLSSFALGSWVEGFGTPYSYSALTSLNTSLANVTVQPGYLVAFEGNGGHGAGVSQGWESSRWQFRDANNSLGVNYFYNETIAVPDNNSDPANAGANGALVASGPILSKEYGPFFGMMCCMPPGNTFQGYIIFDLTAMKIDPNTVFVYVENWPSPTTGEGTPDPDAFGIVTECNDVGGICE